MSPKKRNKINYFREEKLKKYLQSKLKNKGVMIKGKKVKNYPSTSNQNHTIKL